MSHSSCNNIVILLSVIYDQESDTENVPHQYVDNDSFFELASELEVDYNSGYSEDEVLNVTKSMSNKHNLNIPSWKKCTDLDSIISLTDIKKLTNEHPELMLKHPF